MSERFTRTEALIGKEALERLRSARVAIFGVGGVGSFAAEAIARCAVGEIDLIDADTVSVSNINRQLIADDTTVGKYKADVMGERILAINPQAKVNAHKLFFAEDTAALFDFSSYDCVIDAIDTVKSKIELIVRATAAGANVISSMGTGNKLDPTRLEITDIYKTSVCPLARVMRCELKKRGVTRLKVLYSKEEPKKVTVSDGLSDTGRHPPASIAFVPSVAGLIIASEAVRDIISK